MLDRAAVKRALAMLRGRVEYVYFFSKLTSPRWIELLAEQGRFSTPPDVVRDGDSIQFPSWPESDYLSRVAARAPDAAFRALSQIPLTDNQRVHDDLVTVALQLLPRDAATWARTETEWVSKQPWLTFLLPEKLSELTAYLAKSGEMDAALELARHLFALQPDPRREKDDETQDSRFPPEPRARMDVWEYGKALRGLVPVLSQSLELNGLEVFAELLRDAIRLSSMSAKPEPPVDYSFIWREAIELEDPHADVRDLLIDAVRDISVALAARFGCRAVISLLRSREWDIFRRLVLHTIRVTCRGEGELVREAVVDKSAFTDPTSHHEYVLLLRDAFPGLDPNDQQTVLAWIEEGPDRAGMWDRHEKHTGRTPTDDEVQAWVEHWQRDRLSPLKEALPQDWRAKFDDLVARHGAPQFDLALHRMSSGWRSERSPLSKEQLAALGAEELRHFLREWVPPNGFDEPSRSGIVQNLAAQDEAFFVAQAEHADQWSDLHASYIATLLGGLQKLSKAGTRFSWPSVLDLCAALVKRNDSDWDTTWAKQAIAELLITTCNGEADLLPQAMRDRVSALIVQLLEQGFILDQKRVFEEADYLTAAINTVSGKALEAAVRFAVWAKQADMGKGLDRGWRVEEGLPEIADMLGRIVDPANRYPLDARAMLGSQLGPMLWLDEGWVRAHQAQLFPTSSHNEEARRAVWHTYLRYGRPFGLALTLFADQYAHTIEELPQEGEEGEGRREVAHHLAEHLMSYYWQGSLPLGDREGLLRAFFKHASGKIRLYALEFVGRSLQNSDEVPPEPLELLRRLFDWRIEILRQIDDSVRTQAAVELQSFGWWFASAKFRPEWSLETLLKVFSFRVGIEPEHMVAEELVKLADRFPLEVAEALHRLIEQARATYGIIGWRDEVRQLITSLREVNDVAVRALVTASVELLLAQGQLEYRELMPT